MGEDVRNLSDISGSGGPHTHEQSDITDLDTALAGKASSSHGHAVSDVSGLQGELDGKQAAGSYEAGGAVSVHEAALNPHPIYLTKAEGDALYEPTGVSWGEVSDKPSTFTPEAHTHSADAINAGVIATARLGSGTANNTVFLRGDQTWAAPGGGSDPWTYVKLATDKTVSSSAAVSVGLSFSLSAGQSYEFVARLYVRTATATVGPRPGVAWATGLTDGVVFIQQTSSATANVFANGNISAAVLAPVGGVPTTTGSWPALIEGWCIAGGTPSGSIAVQLASETAGTNVFAKAGSFLKYRTVP